MPLARPVPSANMMWAETGQVRTRQARRRDRRVDVFIAALRDAKTRGRASRRARQQQQRLVRAARARQSGRAGSYASSRSWIDRSPAVAQKLAARPIEGEPVSTVRRRLIITSIDRQSRDVAIEQGAGRTMTDDG